MRQQEEEDFEPRSLVSVLDTKTDKEASETLTHTHTHTLILGKELNLRSIVHLKSLLFPSLSSAKLTFILKIPR